VRGQSTDKSRNRKQTREPPDSEEGQKNLRGNVGRRNHPAALLDHTSKPSDHSQMLSRPTFTHQNSMFDTNPHPQKPKNTPPPSPIQNMKTPFSRAGSPVSFRARNTFRATIIVVFLVLVVSITNEIRCAKSSCPTRARFRQTRWVGGGSVIPESIKHKMSNVVEYIDGDDRWMGSVEDSGEDSDWEQGFNEESVLVNPAEGFAGAEEKGNEAGSGRWIDETQGRTLGEEVRIKKPEFLTIPDAFPIVKNDTEEEKETVEDMANEIQKPDGTLMSEMELHLKKGDSGVEQHAKWEQGEGQEDPVRVPGGASSVAAKNENNYAAVGDKWEGQEDPVRLPGGASSVAAKNENNYAAVGDKWEGQEDPVRLPGGAFSVTMKDGNKYAAVGDKETADAESKAIASAEKGTADAESKAIASAEKGSVDVESKGLAVSDKGVADGESIAVGVAADKAVAFPGGKSSVGGGVNVPKFGAMAMDSSGAMG
jgi:hypothetical protein